MIIYENSFIKLDYNPATDVLLVDMPRIDTMIMPEVRSALAIIAEHVRNYDVKRLLVDARQTKVEVNEESYTALISEFSQSLMTTRLQKVARIVSASEVREKAVKKVYERDGLPLQFKNFEEMAPAIEWLTA
ncbi:hypothetical protein [Pontibacter ummariensis]|nr:hypothetical protein [Pontibacter ummariensis]